MMIRAERLHLRLVRKSRQRWQVVVVVLVTLAILILFGIMYWIEGFLSGGLDEWEVKEKLMINSGISSTVSVFSSGHKGVKSDHGVLFIHGTPGSADNFSEQFKYQIPDTIMVSYNRPGFWDSRSKEDPGNIDYQAEAGLEVMNQFDVNQWIVVGHSYGGPVALKMALDAPGRIAGIVLVGGAVDPALEKIHILQKVGRLPLISSIIPDSFDASNRELIQLKPDLISLQKELSGISVSMVMLHGDIDKLVPVSNCYYMRDQLEQHKLGHLLHLDIRKNWNHFIPWEHPQSVIDAITKLIGMAQKNPIPDRPDGGK